MKYLFFDTETTGLVDFAKPIEATGQPRLVQLAWKLCDENFKCRASFYSLMKPDDWEISEKAFAAHGISKEECELYGMDSTLALEAFVDVLKESDLVIAHNHGFDSKVISIEAFYTAVDLCKHNWSGPKNFCTMRAMTGVCKLPGTRGYKWPKLCEAYKHATGVDFQNAHDAMVDVNGCIEVFKFLQPVSA